jgi:hypothetical protein
MTALTLYLNQNPSGTASTADQMMENASTGGTLSNKNTNLTSGTTGWVTLYSQGNGTGQTGAGSQPALADNGWLDDAITLVTNHFNSGTWSVALGFETTTTGTFIADFHFRFYQRSSGGTRTLIGEAIASSQTIISTSYTVLTPSVSASASNTFVTGDKVGLDVTINILTNTTTGNLRMQASSSTTLGNTSAQIVTPGYSSVTTSSRTIPATAALLVTNSRTIPATVALQMTNSRTIPVTVALLVTNSRTIPATAAIAFTHSRTIPATTSIALTSSRTIPATAALLVTNSRTIPATVALQMTNSRTILALAAFITTNTRTIPAKASIALTSSRTIPSIAALLVTTSRTIPATVALLVTNSRTIPATAALQLQSTFYASNVVSSIGGLTQSDQMSTTFGGTETSFTVTASSSGTNTYLELISQGGTPGTTPAPPSPTGKGWSISLAGNTIPYGSWFSAFTLAKSGSSMSGASLYVRWYRRTIDGKYYLIGSTSLSGQTFSAKATYTLPSVTAMLWQFIAGDTLYMDAFVYNAGTAWSSDVFTIYVSNSASLGVVNDGTITTPQVITTPSGLSCLIGVSNFQSASGIPVLNESFTLADALDQRSVLTLTGEDTAGTLTYTPAQPVMFSDSNQGLLYSGYLNSDKITKLSAGGSPQLEHLMAFVDHHRDADKRANTTNYLNWTAGDMTCDFIQQTLSQEGVTGAFALESDYTPATFGQGTLTNVVATTNTTPFTYAPNTASPPVTSNTGDLELAQAGSNLTITEATTAAFSTGTLTSMVAINNTLTPATVSGIKSTSYLPFTTTGAFLDVVFWQGSKSLGTNDTLNYDIWIASSSPQITVTVNILFTDNTTATGILDQNGLAIDATADLSSYAKDQWYTRNISTSTYNGKTIASVFIGYGGTSPGTYTCFVKNVYLSSSSGSPFFSTTATSTQQNPPLIQNYAIYVPASTTSTVIPVYDPAISKRISSSYNIDPVKLIGSSTITWNASSVSGVNFTLKISYDGGVTYQPCTNNTNILALPNGSNVSGLSLLLQESFQGSTDPSIIPILSNVTIQFISAPNATKSDIVAAFGTQAAWNTGTYNGTVAASNGDLSISSISRNWANGSLSGQTFFRSDSNSTTNQSVSAGFFCLDITLPSSSGAINAVSRLDFAGTLTNFVLDIDLIGEGLNYNNNIGAFITYRTTHWGGGSAMALGKLGYGFSFVQDSGGGNNFFFRGSNSSTDDYHVLATGSGTIATHVRIVVNGTRHTCYINNSTIPELDVTDTTYTSGGQIGLGAWTVYVANLTGDEALYFDNLLAINASVQTWTSSTISLSSLGTCGSSVISWVEANTGGTLADYVGVTTSIDGGTTYQSCTNGSPIPNLPSGTNVSGMSLIIRVNILSNDPVTLPIIRQLVVRVLGQYPGSSGTRISPALSLTPVGYVAASNTMWNANIPSNTTLTIATSQDLVTWTNVPNNGAGASLSYWTNQPSSTQDLFNSNTSSNYTNTNKSGGSTATVTYDTTNSRIILSGGSGGLYLNNSISCADIELLCDMDQSDAGGLVFHKIDANNYYELGVYDASSSGGFTNQLRLYKVASGTRTLLGSYSGIIFTRGTVHRIKAVAKGGLINVYWDGKCVQSFLDVVPLGAGACGLRNDGGISRYYQLWIQPLGTNLTGQVLYTKVTMTTSDPSQTPQLFALVACVRGASIATGATIAQLHPITTPFAAYYSSEMDALVRASGDYYWYIDKWKELRFGPRLARPAAFPIQSTFDPAYSSGYLLYQPQLGISTSITTSADLLRDRQIVTDVTSLVTPPPEIKITDGISTSWTMGYPLYSAPTITINGQGNVSVGVQGIDSGRQFYWQPGSPSISYDSSLPKLSVNTILAFTYVGQSTSNVVLNNNALQVIQAGIELNSGIVDEIESALRSSTKGMTTTQATTFGNGLLARYGLNNPIELIGTTLYTGLTPGTVTGIFLPEIMQTWNAQLPIVKVTTKAVQTTTNGVMYFYTIDATNGPGLNNWTQVFYGQ